MSETPPKDTDIKGEETDDPDEDSMVESEEVGSDYSDQDAQVNY